MKKSILLFKTFFVILCLMFCSIGVFAGVPNTLNIQGRYTKSYGDPVVNTEIKVYLQLKEGNNWKNALTYPFTTETDSEGLYNLDVPVEISSNTTRFRVSIGSEPKTSDTGYLLSASPYAFYASTATLALELDTVNGQKLKDDNFLGYTGNKKHTYTIRVDSASYADKSKEISVSSNVANTVWATIDTTGKQGWLDVSSAIAPDYAKKAKELDSSSQGVKLVDNNFLGYTGISTHTYKIKVDSSAWADNAVTANKLNTSFKLSNNNFSTNTEYSNLKLKSSNFTANTVYTATTSWASGAGTANSLSSSFKLANENFNTNTEYSNLKLKSSNFTANTVYTATTSWASGAGTANSLSGSFKLANENFNTNTEYSNLKLVGANFKDNTEYSNLKLYSSNFTENTVYTATTSWASGAGTADSLSGSFKLANENFDTNTEYSNLKLVGANFKDNTEYSNLKLYNSNFTENTVYTATTSWASGAGTADSLSGSFKLANENFDTNTEYSNLKLTNDNFNDEATYSNLKLTNDNFNDEATYSNLKLTNDNFSSDTSNVYSATTTWAQKISDPISGYIDPSEDNEYYVWGAESVDSNSQKWIRTKFHNNAFRGADLAEIYQSSEKLVPGDVVSIDTTKDNAIVKTKVAEDTLVAGVISTEPGVLLNQNEKGYKLALVGKVPTKVCNEGGAIKRGDLLVSASIPGYAKKAGDNPKAGTVIGKALGNLDSQKGTILVLVNLQ